VQEIREKLKRHTRNLFRYIADVVDKISTALLRNRPFSIFLMISNRQILAASRYIRRIINDLSDEGERSNGRSPLCPTYENQPDCDKADSWRQWRLDEAIKI